MPYLMNCDYCAKPYEAEHSHRLFCSDICKVRSHRDQANRCWYCGEDAYTRDHIIPKSALGHNTEKWRSTEWVRCCRECNSLLGADIGVLFSDRVSLLIKRFSKRYRLHKPRVQWDEEELKDVSREMAQSISAHMRLWNARQVRLDHMRLRLARVMAREAEAMNERPEHLKKRAAE